MALKFLSSKAFSILSAFVIGGASTYFVTDYIRLKDSESVSQIETSAEKPRPMTNKSQLREKDDSSDSFAQMDKIHDRIQKRVDKFFGNGMLGGALFDNNLFNSDSFFRGMTSSDLKIEEFEDDEFKYLEILTDGLDKKSISINISGGIISISGKTTKTDENQSAHSRSMSKFVSSFSRSFSIPYGVREENAKIDTKDNKIVIKFPKKRI